MGEITMDRLKAMRSVGDEHADAMAAHFIDEYNNGNATELFRNAMQARYADDDNADPHVRAWLENRPGLPAWVDAERLRRGADFFSEWGIELGLGLFLSSLPLAYASHDGVQVLALTARLETDAKRRILESAQFVLDVTRPGALEPGHEGYETARLVRLMHAGVRHLILNDRRIPRTSDESVWPRWDLNWGVPANQQHLLGAMLSYSSSLLPVLEVFGVDYDRQGAEDYCHLWNVVGWLLGIDETVLPLTMDEMIALDPMIRELNFRESAAGKELTVALIDLVRSFIHVPGLKGLPVSMMRQFVTDEIADMLGAPKANWTRFLVTEARSLTRKMSVAALHDRTLRAVMRWFSRKVLSGFVDHERHGDRPSFTIPTSLGSTKSGGGGRLPKR